MILSKTEIRTINKNKRRQMDKSEVKAKSAASAKAFLSSDIYKNAKVIMLYIPLGNETDTSAIINSALDDGKRVALPVTDINTGEITPHYITKSTELVKGAFSVMEPYKAEIAELSEIDAVLLPGIAFDKYGNRVGFGKGCYDKLLKNSKATKLGYCYQFQICEELKAEQHDVKMDFLVTEKGFFTV